MINKNDLRKAISSIAISNAKRNTIYKAFSDLDSITKEEFDSVKSDISKVVESMLTKDTVGKANGVASLDSNGSVPIEQLGNIDTTLFLIVRELPTDDIKSNKIYLVPNQDGQGDNVYLEYLYVEDVWEKLGEFKPEVDLSYIEEELDNKADLNKAGYINVDQLIPAVTYDKDNNNINAMFQYVTLDKLDDIVKNDNPDNGWQYYDFADSLEDEVVPQYIYDATVDEHIEITATTYLDDIDNGNGGDAFNTAKPLDLTHDLYLDNERIGAISKIIKFEEIDMYKSSILFSTNTKLKSSAKIENDIFLCTGNIDEIDISNTINRTIYINTANDYVAGNIDVDKSIALLTYPTKIKSNSIIIGGGDNTSTTSGIESILIGRYKTSAGRDINIGTLNETKSEHSCAIGSRNISAYNYSCTIGYNNHNYNQNSVIIGNNINSSLRANDDTVSIGYNNSGGNATIIGCNNKLIGGVYKVCIGSSAYCGGIVNIGYSNSTSEGYYATIGIGHNLKADNSYNSIIIGEFNAPTESIYKIGYGTNANNRKNLEETLNINSQHKKYIYGIGGYDGTNPATEGVKSLQEVLVDKADASSIPTKVSQLTNDSNFITSYTETDPVWTSEKTNYYTKTEIDGKGYLTAHQSLDGYVTMGNDNTPAQLFKGQGTATINAKQLLLNSPSGGVNIQPDSINIGSTSFTFKASATEGLVLMANSASKGIAFTPGGGINSIGFNGANVNIEKGGSLVGQNVAGAVYNVNGNFVNLNPLYDLEGKFRDAIAIHVALDNITEATTAEEVVTKFNQLLKSLKAIGLMKPDTTAE